MARHLNSRVYFYQITCVLHEGKVAKGIKDHFSCDIDYVWTVFRRQAEENYGARLEEFNCIQLSSHSREVKQYIKQNDIRIASQKEYSDDYGDIKEDDQPSFKTIEEKMNGGDWKRTKRPGKVD